MNNEQPQKCACGGVAWPYWGYFTVSTVIRVLRYICCECGRRSQ